MSVLSSRRARRMQRTVGWSASPQGKVSEQIILETILNHRMGELATGSI